MIQAADCTELARRFGETSSLVDASIGRYLGRLVTSPGREFSRTVMFAIALLDAWAHEEEPAAQDFSLVRSACASAAGACRARGRHRDMLTSALALQQVVDACDAALRIRTR